MIRFEQDKHGADSVPDEVKQLVEFIVSVVNVKLPKEIPHPCVSEDDPIQDRAYEYFPSLKIKR